MHVREQLHKYHALKKAGFPTRYTQVINGKIYDTHFETDSQGNSVTVRVLRINEFNNQPNKETAND